MKFYGLQKMTLLDFPGKVACTVFTGGCNFRCPFCHNALLVTKLDSASAYDEEEVLAFLKSRAGLLDGICITGGEPLMHPEITGFIRKVRALGYAVKLDTNGSYPHRLKALVGEGLLDYVAMDIKNSPEKYAQTIGVSGFDLTPVRESVEFLLSGVVPFEFRTTVVAELHTPQDIVSVSRWITGADRYYLQVFVDSGNLIGENFHAVPPSVIQDMQEKAQISVPNTQLRGM